MSEERILRSKSQQICPVCRDRVGREKVTEKYSQTSYWCTHKVLVCLINCYDQHRRCSYEGRFKTIKQVKKM